MRVSSGTRYTHSTHERVKSNMSHRVVCYAPTPGVISPSREKQDRTGTIVSDYSPSREKHARSRIARARYRKARCSAKGARSLHGVRSDGQCLAIPRVFWGLCSSSVQVIQSPLRALPRGRTEVPCRQHRRPFVSPRYLHAACV